MYYAKNYTILEKPYYVTKVSQFFLNKSICVSLAIFQDGGLGIFLRWQLKQNFVGLKNFEILKKRYQVICTKFLQ